MLSMHFVCVRTALSLFSAGFHIKFSQNLQAFPPLIFGVYKSSVYRPVQRVTLNTFFIITRGRLK